jgi:hypothetical protein
MMRPARSAHEKPGVSERVASMMVITRSVTDGYPHCRPSARVRTSGPGPRPELRIPNVAAQTRIVSVARIRLDARKSVRPFKGIICDDVSEFESHMASHAVRSLPANIELLKAPSVLNCRRLAGLPERASNARLPRSWRRCWSTAKLDDALCLAHSANSIRRQCQSA